jgi:hypothetical protein
MIKPIKHSNRNLQLLLERVDYIEDPEEHVDKTLTVARNYNCADQTKDAFISRSKEMDAAYFAYREGKKGPKGHDLFWEFTYSCERYAYLTPEERDAVEKILVAKFAGPNAAVRTAWHISPDGRADIHLLICAKAPSIENPDAYVYLFGKNIGNYIAACQATDRKIAKLLNSNPDRRIEHTAAIDVYIGNKNEKHKDKKRKLGHQIARKFPGLKITADNIKKVLIELGHEVLAVTANAVRLIFQGRKNESQLSLRNLLLSIGEAQVALAHEMELATQMSEQESPRVPETQPTPESDTPFAKLLAFYTAATGREIVRPRKLRKLTESTKGMLTKAGKIKRAVLSELSDDQKAILSPLVEAYSKQIAP